MRGRDSSPACIDAQGRTCPFLPLYALLRGFPVNHTVGRFPSKNVSFKKTGKQGVLGMTI